MMSRLDPRMNVLRATSAAFAAAVGGADSITVLPFDIDGADAGARRLARNTQSILIEEAHIDRVADPAAGSGLVEAMTVSLAEAAWGRFQKIERAGGVIAAIRDGALIAEVAAEREARLAAAVGGGLQMVGVNAFTKAPAVPAAVPVADETRLVFRRLSEAFEEHAP
jgi:methylmalonyl-CoA mutase